MTVQELCYLRGKCLYPKRKHLQLLSIPFTQVHTRSYSGQATDPIQGYMQSWLCIISLAAVVPSRTRKALAKHSGHTGAVEPAVVTPAGSPQWVRLTPSVVGQGLSRAFRKDRVDSRPMSQLHCPAKGTGHLQYALELHSGSNVLKRAMCNAHTLSRGLPIINLMGFLISRRL